jgi:hypothetical protein
MVMKYHELLERDDSKVIKALNALINHPTTSDVEKETAKHILAAVMRRQVVPATDHNNLVYGSNGKMTTAGRPKGYIARKF